VPSPCCRARDRTSAPDVEEGGDRVCTCEIDPPMDDTEGWLRA
jgi:hypothetical protein